MIIDTHCHLNIDEFLIDRDDIIKNAVLNQVSHMICIGMYEEANIEALNIANQYSNIFATVGIHPSYVNQGYDETKLRALAKEKKVVAIGEIGIDLFWVKDNLEVQKEYFKRQLDLSLELKLPVVIHMRESATEIYEILKDYKNLKGVMHCFSEDITWANKFIDLGFYIGIGGPVTYKNNSKAKMVARNIPIDRLLVETDSPFLAPVPKRGKRNEPAYTKYIVEQIALLRGLSPIEVARITTQNAIKLFKLGGIES